MGESGRPAGFLEQTVLLGSGPEILSLRTPGGLGVGEQEDRKPTAESTLPSFSPPLPRVLHPQAPYAAALHPCLPHRDAMHCPQALVPCLALPTTLLCLTCPTAPAPLLAEALLLPCESPSSLCLPRTNKVLTRGPRGPNTQSGGLGPGHHYLLTLVSFCPSVAPVLEGEGADITSVRPKAHGSPPTITALPWHDTVSIPQTCTETHPLMHTAHTPYPAAHDTCRGPSPGASRSSPQGMGHLTLAPQEGGSLDFWDTPRGHPKPRRRRKSLRTFSLTPATFRGIGHWRVSAISLSGPMPTPLLLPRLQPAPLALR